MRGNPRIGSKVRIRSTGETGKITGHMKFVSGRKSFIVEYDKPDKEGWKGARVDVFDVEVIR